MDLKEIISAVLDRVSSLILSHSHPLPLSVASLPFSLFCPHGNPSGKEFLFPYTSQFLICIPHLITTVHPGTGALIYLLIPATYRLLFNLAAGTLSDSFQYLLSIFSYFLFQWYSFMNFFDVYI